MKALSLLSVWVVLAAGLASEGASAIEFKGFSPERQTVVEAAISEVAADFAAFEQGSRSAFEGILNLDEYGSAIKGEAFASTTFGASIQLRYAGDEKCASGAAAQVFHDDTNKKDWVATLRICPLFFEMTPTRQAQIVAHELYHVVQGADECYARYTEFWVRAPNGKPYHFDGFWADYECQIMSDYLPPADMRTHEPDLLASVDIAAAAPDFGADKWRVGEGIIGVRSSDGSAYLGIACTPVKPVAVYGIGKIGATTALNLSHLLVANDVPENASLDGRAAGRASNIYVNGRANGPAFLELNGEVAEFLAEVARGAQKTLTLQASDTENPTLVFGRSTFTASGSSAAARYLLGGC